MPRKCLHLNKKECRFCGQQLILKSHRDVTRKNFCSHKCRALYYVTYIQTPQQLKFMRQQAYTPAANAKKSHKGSKHPRYITDRSKIKYRPRYEHSEWKIQVFTRDNYTCQICGQVGGKLQAHHIKTYSQYPELRWDVDNGQTLCIICHKQTDSYGRKNKEKCNAFS